MNLRRFLFFAALALAALSPPPLLVAQSTAKTFTLNAANPNACIGVTGLPTVGIYVSGTFSLTLQPQTSINGSTPQNSQVTPATSTTKQSTITAVGNYTAGVGGYDTFCLNVSAYVSGSATVLLNPSPALNSGLLGGGGNVTLISASGAPPGNCPNIDTQYLNTDNGNLYSCPVGGSGWVLIGGGASGFVTHTAGPLTTHQIAVGNGSGDLTVDPDAITDGVGDVSATSFATSGSNGGFSQVEGTGVNCFSLGGGTGLAASDCLWADSTAHRWRMNNNNAGPVTLMSTADAVVAAQMPALTGDATTSPGSVVTTVGSLKGVPVCTGVTPTNGQNLQYSTALSPNPCLNYSSAGAAKNGWVEFSFCTTGASAMTFTSGTNFYFGVGLCTSGTAPQATETIVQMIAPFTGTAQHLMVHMGTAPTAGTSVVFTLRDAAAGTALTCTWSAGQTCTDTTHTATVTQGDLIDVQILCTTGTGSCAALLFNVNATLQIL